MKNKSRTLLIKDSLTTKNLHKWQDLGECLKKANRQFRYVRGINAATGALETYLDIPIGRYRTIWQEINTAIQIFDEMDRS